MLNLKKANFELLFKILLTCCLISYIILILLQVIFNDTVFIRTSFLIKDEAFSDFAESLKFAYSKNPYEVFFTSYPPLAIILCYPFAQMCKSVITTDFNVLLNSNIFKISYIIYLIIVLSVIFFCFTKILKYSFKDKKLWVFFGIFLTCAPIVFAISRGNIIFFAFMFTMLFLAGYKSNNKIIRELSYISLAIAGAIKIYPLFFGVLILKKSIFQSIRVGIYFLLLFFLPFLCFENGLDNISYFLRNMSAFVTERTQLASCSISFYSFFMNIIFVLNRDLNMPYPEFLILFLKIVSYLIFISAIISAFFIKDEFKLNLLIVCTICIVPTISYFYVAVFLLIPFAIFYKNYNQKEMYPDKKQFNYYFVFLYIFSIITMIKGPVVAVQTIMIVSIEIYLIISAFKDLTKKIQGKIIK